MRIAGTNIKNNVGRIYDSDGPRSALIFYQKVINQEGVFACFLHEPHQDWFEDRLRHANDMKDRAPD